MITLRSAMTAGIIALSCVGISQPADAQRHGGFSGGRGGFDHGGFGGNRFFFGFGFGGYGFGGYPYYPYYPGYYYPPYYPYPYYPPYYPAAAPGGYPGAAPGGYPGAAPGGYPGATGSVDPAMVRQVQAELQRQGYNVGPLDGRLGPRTKAAIRQYEQQNGLPVDGLPSRSLRDHMQSQSTG